MVKVLILPKKFYTTYVAGFIKDFVQQLKKKGWKIMPMEDIKTNDPMKDMKKSLKIKTKPKVIAFYILRESVMEKWKDLKKLGTLNVLIAEDVHNEHDVVVIKGAKKWGIDVIFARYPLNVKEHIPRTKIPIIHLPHGFMKEFLLPINFSKKKNACLLSGAIDEDIYPLREKLDENLNLDFIVKRKHPGYGKIKDPLREARNYAKDINKYKLAVADCGFLPDLKNPYVIAKQFEIPAAGTAVINHDKCKKELRKLGFRDKVNYISCTEKNLIKTIEYWLDKKREKKLKEITKKGQDLVKKLHSTNARVKFFDNSVK